MLERLKTVSELDERSELREINQAMSKLKTAAEAYERSHTGLFVAGKGYGAERLRIARESRELVTSMTPEMEAGAWMILKTESIRATRRRITDTIA